MEGLISLRDAHTDTTAAVGPDATPPELVFFLDLWIKEIARKTKPTIWPEKGADQRPGSVGIYSKTCKMASVSTENSAGALLNKTKQNINFIADY